MLPHDTKQFKEGVLLGISIGTSILLGLWFYFIRSPWVPFGLWFHTAYRPLVSGLVVGLIMGDPVQGTIIGAGINLIYMGFISAGGSAPADPSLAGVMGTALALASNLSVEQALVLATPIGILGGMLNTARMTVNSYFPHKMEEACCEKGSMRGVYFWHIAMPQVTQFLATFPVVVLGCYFGAPVVESFINNLPAIVMSTLTVIGTMLPALGICLNLSIIAKRDTMPLFILGYFLVQYLNLSVVAVTVFGGVIAVMRYVLASNKEKQVESDLEIAEDTKQTLPEQKVKLSRRDIFSSYSSWRWWAFSCYNYETLQAMGFAQAMIKPLQKLYPDKERFKQEMRKHFAFFNTEPHIGCIIFGIALAMEEQRANGADVSEETINATKTGLMGPLAGIGDTITQGITTPIMLAIGISIAQEGSIMGPILFVILNAALLIGLSYGLWIYGYRLGGNAVQRLISGGLMQQLMIGAGTLGCIVLGAMAAGNVKMTTPISFNIGQAAFALQTDLFDKILPGLLPLILTLVVYQLLKKGVTSNRVLLIIVIVGLVGGLLGILA